MLYQVIGVERKTGDFTPRDGSNRQIHYDNLVLHSVTLKRLVGCAGQKAEQCSIKVVDSADLLEAVGAMDDFSKVVGHQFDFETSYGENQELGVGEVMLPAPPENAQPPPCK